MSFGTAGAACGPISIKTAQAFSSGSSTASQRAVHASNSGPSSSAGGSVDKSPGAAGTSGKTSPGRAGWWGAIFATATARNSRYSPSAHPSLSASTAAPAAPISGSSRGSCEAAAGPISPNAFRARYQRSGSSE